MKKLLPVFLLIVVFSCKKSTDGDNVDLTYNYFPAKTGSTWVYHIDSLVYDDNSGHTKIDTFTYQYKEVLGEKYATGADSTQEYRLYRYYKSSDTTDWVEANAWTVLKSSTRMEKVQENIRYVKLLFPLSVNRQWNGNQGNNKGDEEYSVSSFDVPYANYDKTARIDQFDEENLIEEIRRYEIYARDIGMVYSLSDSLNTQTSGTRGFRFRKTLVSYTP